MKKATRIFSVVLSISAVICLVATAVIAIKASIRADRANAQAKELAEMSAVYEIKKLKSKIETIDRCDRSNEMTGADIQKTTALIIEKMMFAKTQLQQYGESNDVLYSIDDCIALIRSNEGSMLRIAEKVDEVITKLSDGGSAVGDVEEKQQIIKNDRGKDFLRFNVKAELTEDAVLKLAEKYFSDNSAFARAEGNSFPPSVTMCGENIYVSLSCTGGELLELIFDRPAGKKELDSGYCKDKAVAFLLSCGINFDELTVKTEEDELFGVYRIIFENEEKEIQTAVRWDTGRICYYNAYNYYR